MEGCLSLSRLGPAVLPEGVVRFGVLLPWIDPSRGFDVTVCVVSGGHGSVSGMGRQAFRLEHRLDPVYGDCWSGEFRIEQQECMARESKRNAPRRYTYHYMVRGSGGRVAGPILDPFARESGAGSCSSFDLAERPYHWGPREEAWRVPALRDLVVYELMIPSFVPDVMGVERKLDYLSSLGVNALQLTPVVKSRVPADYLPLSHVAVDERLGYARDMKRLVEQAHLRGIAVMLDVVYAHTGSLFPYYRLYRELGFKENPVMGAFARDDFGESMDFRRPFTRDYCLAVNRIWMEEYHVDGFRYDCVPGYWDGPVGEGFAALAYGTDRMVRCESGRRRRYWVRFRGAGAPRLIQCAEALDQPEHVLPRTAANCVWQTRTLDSARAFARGECGSHSDFGLRLGAWGFPTFVRHGSAVLPKAVVHYIESHDNARLCNFLQPRAGDAAKTGALRRREVARRLRPYLVALLTVKGIPMLWQGQEFGAGDASAELDGRISTNVYPLDWSLSRDVTGLALRRLVVRVVRLRRDLPELRHGLHFFHRDVGCDVDVIVQSRRLGRRCCVVAINFGDTDREVGLRFPVSGEYVDAIGGENVLRKVTRGEIRRFVVPAQFARLWVRKVGFRDRVRSCTG